MNFDTVRAAYPQIGIAVYALEPGGPVTLEIYDGGEVYAFYGQTADEALALAFPEQPAVADVLE